MTIRRRDLHPGNNQEVVDRLSVRPLQSLLNQIFMRLARIMVSDGDAAQSPGFRGRDQFFRRAGRVR